MVLLGLVSCFLAALILSTTYVPIRRYPPTDGFFALLMICVSALVVAIFVNIAEGNPPLYGLAILGGCIWCIGNSLVFFIMNNLGLAPAALIWNTFSCLIGWSVPRFGLFGIPEQTPKSIGLNYIGIVTLIFGGALYVFIKNNDPVIKAESIVNEKPPLEEIPNVEYTQPTNTLKMKILSVLAAIFAGSCFGNMLTPITYIQSHPELYPEAPQRGLPYMLSFHLGAFLTCVIVYSIYCVFKRNEPVQPPHLALSSLVGGLTFGVGMIFFLLGLELLSQSISYPLIAMLPGLFLSLYSIVYFKEITGQRNYIILSTAYVFTLIGVGLVTISKDVEFF